MKLNTKVAAPAIRTHEGAPAHPASLDPVNQLRRSVLSCLLWESEFYEDGQEIAARIADTARKVPPHVVAALAREARGRYHLRHVPLLLLSILADTGKGTTMVPDAIGDVIQRADEVAELLAVRVKVTGKPIKDSITHGMRKGLARAFRKFSAYQLAKYNRDGAFKLRDALFLSFAKPDSEEQAAVWKQLVDGTLPAPDTWETRLSASGQTGVSRKEAWEGVIDLWIKDDDAKPSTS